MASQNHEQTHNLFVLLRRQTGLTQQKVADLVGVSGREIRRWEAGHVRVPKLVIEMLQNMINKQAL